MMRPKANRNQGSEALGQWESNDGPERRATSVAEVAASRTVPLSCDVDCDATRSEDVDRPGSTVVDDDQWQARNSLSCVIFIIIARIQYTSGVTTTNQEVAGSSPVGRTT